MANWKTTCDIKQFIEDEDMETREKVEKIAEKLAECPEFDDTLYAEYLTEILDLEDDDLEQEANGYLEWVYDFADENRIWMGPVL